MSPNAFRSLIIYALGVVVGVVGTLVVIWGVARF